MDETGISHEPNPERKKNKQRNRQENLIPIQWIVKVSLLSP